MQHTSSPSHLWHSSTSKIFWGMVVLTVFGWIASFAESAFGIVDTLIAILHHVDELPDDLDPHKLIDDFSVFQESIGIVMRVFEPIVIVGWIVYAVGLSKFRKAQISADACKWTGSLYTACRIGLVSVLLYCLAGFVGLFGILFRLAGWLTLLVSLAKFFESSEALSCEESWNDQARQGAKNLRVSYVLAIILQILPIIMGVIVFFAISGVMANLARLVYVVATDGVGALQPYVTSFSVLIKILGVAIAVVWICEVVLLFMGWLRIKRGGLVLPEEPNRN